MGLNVVQLLLTGLLVGLSEKFAAVFYSINFHRLGESSATHTSTHANDCFCKARIFSLV